MLDEKSFRNAKILLVDDERSCTNLMRSMLEGAGYTHVHATNDPREAAKLYASLRPDIVVLDLNMPKLDGFGVLSELASVEQEAWLPVLVVSGEDASAVLLKCLESGARDFVGKPYQRVEVLTRIRNMLEVRLLHNEVRDQNRLLEDRVRARTAELRETQFEVIRRL